MDQPNEYIATLKAAVAGKASDDLVKILNDLPGTLQALEPAAGVRVVAHVFDIIVDQKDLDKLFVVLKEIPEIVQYDEDVCKQVIYFA